MSKQAKTFRLDEKVWNNLQKYAEAKNLTQTEAIQSAIQLAIQSAIQEKHTEQYNFQASEAMFKTLSKQLDVKDKQIEKLNEALLASQQQTNASQVLQAAGKKSELLLSEPRKLTWKERFTGKTN